MCEAAEEDDGGCGADTAPARRRRLPAHRWEPGAGHGLVSPPARSRYRPRHPAGNPRYPSGTPSRAAPGTARCCPRYSSVPRRCCPQNPPMAALGTLRCRTRYLSSTPGASPRCHLRFPPPLRFSSGTSPVSPSAACGTSPVPSPVSSGVGQDRDRRSPSPHLRSVPSCGPGDHLCSYSHPRPCMKCKQGSAALIIRLGDAFCRDCFHEYFVHKFRAMLGKNRVIFPGEKVLSGGRGRWGDLGGSGGTGDPPFCPRRCCWHCQGGRPPAPCSGRSRR
uniref:Cytoplasmic tRNA 2-thiolation protein 2 n=1 Tax=Calidris pygmaea TaxID=425635 RepID=A0A8C3KA69_9CHAR